MDISTMNFKLIFNLIFFFFFMLVTFFAGPFPGPKLKNCGVQRDGTKKIRQIVEQGNNKKEKNNLIENKMFVPNFEHNEYNFFHTTLDTVGTQSLIEQQRYVYAYLRIPRTKKIYINIFRLVCPFEFTSQIISTIIHG